MGFGPDGKGRGRGELAEGGHDDGAEAEGRSCKETEGCDGDNLAGDEGVVTVGKCLELEVDSHLLDVDWLLEGCCGREWSCVCVCGKKEKKKGEKERKERRKRRKAERRHKKKVRCKGIKWDEERDRDRDRDRIQLANGWIGWERWT